MESEESSSHMLTLTTKFDLRRDVVSDILRKERSACRVKGEAFRCLFTVKYRQLT